MLFPYCSVVFEKFVAKAFKAFDIQKIYQETHYHENERKREQQINMFVNQVHKPY